MPRFRPRISLLAALLLMTIAGMAIVIVQLWREVGPLRVEVHRLRTEQGHLHIDDPTKVSVIEGLSYEEHAWVWRIYLPPGQFSLCFCCDTLPPLTSGWDAEWFKSLKHVSDWASLSAPGFSGELLLEARLVNDGNRTRLHATFSGTNGSGGGGTAFAIDSKAGGRSSHQLVPVAHSFRIGTRQKSFQPNQPILLRYDGGSTADQRKGFVIWIEPPSPIRQPVNYYVPPNE